MTREVFQKVTQPYFLGYYYKNEEEKDWIVSIEAMQEFHRLSGTPSHQKIMKAFPEWEATS